MAELREQPVPKSSFLDRWGLRGAAEKIKTMGRGQAEEFKPAEKSEVDFEKIFADLEQASRIEDEARSGSNLIAFSTIYTVVNRNGPYFFVLSRTHSASGVRGVETDSLNISVWNGLPVWGACSIEPGWSGTMTTPIGNNQGRHQESEFAPRNRRFTEGEFWQAFNGSSVNKGATEQYAKKQKEKAREVNAAVAAFFR